ncbi:MAG: cupin domain-containing protein [Bacteroidetes bacterium]|nr:cupin domain-containing protein [Bacteroidota bacterium]
MCLADFDSDRSLATSILFLLKAGQSSALHRIKSDELWYYHDGEGLELWKSMNRAGKW